MLHEVMYLHVNQHMILLVKYYYFHYVHGLDIVNATFYKLLRDEIKFNEIIFKTRLTSSDHILRRVGKTPQPVASFARSPALFVASLIRHQIDVLPSL